MSRSPIHWLVLAALVCMGLAVATGAGSRGEEMSSTSTSTTTHVNYKTAKSFEGVTHDLERQLGRFDPNIYKPSPGSNPDMGEITRKSIASEGSSGLMIFAKYDHGGLLALAGRKTAACQYVIGNPLVALQMTQVDVRAGEYAPLRLLVYTGDDKMTHIDYDLPSSIFDRFNSPGIDPVGKELDGKFERLVKFAVE